MLLCLLPLLTACGANEVIIEKPVPVEVPVIERVQVPADLLIRRSKTTLPMDITWGEAIQLWAADRDAIDILNAQLDAIQSLNESTSSDSIE